MLRSIPGSTSNLAKKSYDRTLSYWHINGNVVDNFMENQFKMAYKWEYSGMNSIWEHISLTSLTAPWSPWAPWVHPLNV